jgi:hypothetical protein
MSFWFSMSGTSKWIAHIYTFVVNMNALYSISTQVDLIELWPGFFLTILEAGALPNVHWSSYMHWCI